MNEISFTIKRFEELNTKELYEFLCARADVFTTEEEILYPDADGLDYDAIHVFTMGEDGRVKAYLRMFPKADEPGTLQMGRILTVERGKGLGIRLMEAAMDYAEGELDVHEFHMNSQEHAAGFYEKLGFQRTSEVFIEAGIPHVEMRKHGHHSINQGKTK